MGTSEHNARAFMRHPTDIPIQISVDAEPLAADRRLKNVGAGGLACISSKPLMVGSLVSVTIPLVSPPFETQGMVVWCHGSETHFDVGIRFIAQEDHFAARMVEQICHIEHYRNKIRRTEGRQLDGEEAALEWISKHAAEFPPHPAA